MSPGRPITEADLHAYVDDALDQARRAEVDVYLKQHADVAQRVQGYVQQRSALRAMLAPIAEEPIPPELDLATLVEARRKPAFSVSWRAVAAAILLVSLGGAGGWSIRGMSSYTESSGISALAQEAAFNYAVYSPDRLHPVELRAGNSAELVRWISNRLQTPIMVPDLSAAGYQFMGGRLVATAHGPAGLLMYDNGQGIRLVMFVRPMQRDMNTPKMSQSVSGPVTGFSWADDGVGYSVVGAAPADILHPIANEIRRQMTTGI
jgi:anti-sigma factor RsiW